MSIRLRRWDWALGSVSLLLAGAGIAASFFVLEQESHLTSASRYNAVFDISQTSAQIARLEADLAASLIPGAKVSRDDVMLRADILASRMDVLENGEPHVLLSRQADSGKLIAATASLLEALRATQSPADQLDLLSRLHALNAPAARMTSMANETAGEFIHDYQAQLAVTYWSVFGIIVLMIGSGFTLVGVLLRRSAQAWKAARTDTLTGLCNRRALYDFFDDASVGAGTGTTIALLLMDLDRFKAVNDTLGHAAGDELLVEVARRLVTQASTARLVARLGGDEFAIVLIGRDAGQRAETLAARICLDLSRPASVASTQVNIGVSIGISTSESLGNTAHSLLQRADLALYAGKNGGRGGYRFYRPDMQETEISRQSLEAELREALPARQFELWFQPIVDAASGQIVGSEALIRWRHPVRGLVSPADFIPLAEESGLIEPIGTWVLEEACTIAAGWPSDVRVSVNLSARQLQSERLNGQVLAALRRSGLSPHRLEVEVTESMLIRDVERVSMVLAELRLAGLTIALDDFGTGYASLSYLDRFPIDKIKIDQSFVRSLTTKPSSAAVVKAVTVLAGDLGIVVIAEGVETMDHLMQVRAAGCRHAQGYLFSPPVPAADFAAMLETDSLQKVA